MPSLDPGSLSAITFDLYGTLLDLEATFAPGFESFLLERGSTLDAPEMVRTWEWAYLHEGMVNTLLGGPRTPFEQLRRTTLSQLFSQYGVAHKRDDIEELLGNQVTPTLFPDVIDALKAMRDRFTLSVLSNGDLAVLERIVTTLNLPVHRTISVEQAGSYKPDMRVYRRAAELLSVDTGSILHVAAHSWDVRAARVAGMKGAYVDRHGIPYAPFTDDQPDAETPNLPDLASLLA